MDNKKTVKDVSEDKAVEAIVKEAIELVDDMEIKLSDTQKKAFYKSKIVWLSFAGILLTFSDQLGLATQYVPIEYRNIASIVLGVLIIVSRISTNKQLSVKEQK